MIKYLVLSLLVSCQLYTVDEVVKEKRKSFASGARNYCTKSDEFCEELYWEILCDNTSFEGSEDCEKYWNKEQDRGQELYDEYFRNFEEEK